MSTSHRWFLTSTGRQFFPHTAVASDVHIEDIAHALSNICRFGGHCREFYSVAQHSILVSHNVPRAFALAALLHDAPEGLGLVDVPSPVKHALQDYCRIESEIWRAVCDRFDLPHCLPEEVKLADRRALVTERRDIMPVQLDPSWSWGIYDSIEPFPEHISPLSPRWAKYLFLQRYKSLTSRP